MVVVIAIMQDSSRKQPTANLRRSNIVDIDGTASCLRTLEHKESRVIINFY